MDKNHYADDLMEAKIEMMTKEDLNNIVWVDGCPVCNGDGLDSD